MSYAERSARECRSIANRVYWGLYPHWEQAGVQEVPGDD